MRVYVNTARWHPQATDKTTAYPFPPKTWTEAVVIVVGSNRLIRLTSLIVDINPLTAAGISHRTWIRMLLSTSVAMYRQVPEWQVPVWTITKPPTRRCGTLSKPTPLPIISGLRLTKPSSSRWECSIRWWAVVSRAANLSSCKAPMLNYKRLWLLLWYSKPPNRCFLMSTCFTWKTSTPRWTQSLSKQSYGPT